MGKGTPLPDQATETGTLFRRFLRYSFTTEVLLPTFILTIFFLTPFHISAIQLFARQTAEDGVHPADHFGKDLPVEDPPSNVDPDDEDYMPIASARITTAGKPQAQASVQEISDDEEGFLVMEPINAVPISCLPHLPNFTPATSRKRAGAATSAAEPSATGASGPTEAPVKRRRLKKSGNPPHARGGKRFPTSDG